MSKLYECIINLLTADTRIQNGPHSIPPSAGGGQYEVETINGTSKTCKSNYKLLPCLSQFLHKLGISVESCVSGRFFDCLEVERRLDIFDVNHLMQSRGRLQGLNVSLDRNDCLSLSRNNRSSWYPSNGTNMSKSL